MPLKALALCGVLALAVPLAQADIFGFTCLTNNSGNCAALAPQLFVELTDAGSNQVLFKFTNVGPLASSITDVYFDDGTLLGIANVINGPSGVDFSQGASPGDLPGGNAADPDFETTAGFSADSNPAAQPNGVNPPDEFVSILFNLIAGKTFADTLSAMYSGDDLRVGIHVQGLAGGQSESMINTTPTPIPEPGSVLLLGTVLLGVCRLVRRRRPA